MEVGVENNAELHRVPEQAPEVDDRQPERGIGGRGLGYIGIDQIQARARAHKDGEQEEEDEQIALHDSGRGWPARRMSWATKR